MKKIKKSYSAQSLQQYDELHFDEKLLAVASRQYRKVLAQIKKRKKKLKNHHHLIYLMGEQILHKVKQVGDTLSRRIH